MADSGWTEQSESLLRTWLRRARYSQDSNYAQGHVYLRANYFLAVPVIVITTVLGTAAFASLQTQVASLGVKLSVGVLSIVAAVLAALQTHFKYSQRAEKLKNLGARYGDIRREIEEVLSLPVADSSAASKILDDIRKKFDAVASEGDLVSSRVWKRTVRSLERKDAARPDGPSAGLLA
jgi:hypothetical protein